MESILLLLCRGLTWICSARAFDDKEQEKNQAFFFSAFVSPASLIFGP